MRMIPRQRCLNLESNGRKISTICRMLSFEANPTGPATTWNLKRSIASSAASRNWEQPSHPRNQRHPTGKQINKPAGHHHFL